MYTLFASSSLRLIRNPSSQYVVLTITSDDPGWICSKTAPDGNGGELSLMMLANGPNSADTNVDSSGFVVSIFSRIPSTLSIPTMVARVVMIDVAFPPSVATVTLETNFPVCAAVSNVMVWYAGPTSLTGAGIESVIEYICSELSGNAFEKAQKNGDDRVTSFEEYINSHSPLINPEMDDACPTPNISPVCSKSCTMPSTSSFGAFGLRLQHCTNFAFICSIALAVVVVVPSVSAAAASEDLDGDANTNDSSSSLRPFTLDDKASRGLLLLA